MRKPSIPVTLCNSAMCEACDRIHRYFAHAYGVNRDDADEAIEELNALPKGSEPVDDEDDLLQYWKDLRKFLMSKVPTHLLAF
jgi:hypothetical protein